ncbi:MAG: AzlD domain-containing protein [Phyllobacteriaceae bacterium]|nr:AzlD domain-containing protein [Phyllobacteriaceae bacterium]
MSFHAIDAWWWSWLYITVAGVIANGMWRALGVVIGDRLDEESEFMALVRAVATGLVAAVIGNLVVFPVGALAGTPLALRLGALAAGFVAYLLAGKRMIAAILVTETILVAGILAIQL